MTGAAAAYQYRKLKSNVMMGVTVAATVVTLVPLFLVLGYLLYKGASSLNLNFFIHLPRPVGESGGGMGNAILGTLQIVGIACLARSADRNRRRLVPRRASPHRARQRSAFRSRRDDGRAVDRGRDIRLRRGRAADGRILGARGRLSR